MDEWLSRVASDPGFIVAVVSVVVNGFAPTVAQQGQDTSALDTGQGIRFGPKTGEERRARNIC